MLLRLAVLGFQHGRVVEPHYRNLDSCTAPRLCLAAGTADWRGLADSLAQLCGISPLFSLQLRALCCWALTQSSTPPAHRPLLLRGRPRLSAHFRRMAREGVTPILSVLLVAMPVGLTPGGVPSFEGMVASLQQVDAGKMPTLHALHGIGFDPETEGVGPD